MLRTHTCGELTKKNINQAVTVCGWVHRWRNLGGLLFLDLRDRYGLTQIVVDPKKQPETYAAAKRARGEWVARVQGKVVARPKEMVNQELITGEIEIAAEKFTVLSEAKTPPFEIDSETKAAVNEEMRLQYRYLDLRRAERMELLVKRHEFVAFIRQFLSQCGFLEVETPVLTKSTPEGARDFLVPSRLHPGLFYALPQSPQQYKQILMLAGADRYFQIARCFRDEDTRGDRQAEFTQLDLEMSFVEREDVLALTEELFTAAIKKIFPAKKIKFKPWPRLDYDEIMLKYGCDKPDLRFGLEISDVSELVAGSGFKVFQKVLASGGVARALCAPAAAWSKAQLEKLEELAKKNGAKGLIYLIIDSKGEIKSPILKFLGEELAKKIIAALKAKPGDVIFMVADKPSAVGASLAAVRHELGRRLNLADEREIALAFVVNFPLFEEELADGHYAPSHHMFTAPRNEDIKLLDANPAQVKSYQYDLIGNGYELGGGSIRIHDRDLQAKIFNLIGFSAERKEQFAHFLRAFEFGVPPHGGIAPGIDRILMVLTNQASIRDVMAFPKTGDGRDLMMAAPSPVEEKQLKELKIKVSK